MDKNNSSATHKHIKNNPRCPISSFRLKLILLEDVDKIGMKGDLVNVKRGVGRNKLIPNKLAIYATEENMTKHGIDPESLDDSTSTKVPMNVVKFLKEHHINLVTPLIEGIPEGHNWIITRHDIAEYFHRRAYLQVPVTCINIVDCEDNIIRDTGSYIVEITINNVVTIPVALNVKEREIDTDEASL